MTGKAFLNVEKSVSGQKWLERLAASERPIAEAISQRHELPELIGRVLAGRGVKLEEAASFLHPTLRDLMPDPSTITDMGKASDRLLAAIRNREKVAVFGDYDVDGACSAALLARFMGHHDVATEIYIPDRIFEGYGPNAEAIGQLIDNGAGLIVTVDCGSTSFEALKVAEERGIDTIVLDHHQVGTELPITAALVNPNRQDDLSGLGYLSAAGVVFMTLVATLRSARDSGMYSDRLQPPDLMQWLDMVALSTVCDVVPLQGLNRAFVRRGLEIVRNRTNTGIKSLLEVSRLDAPPTVRDLGFLIGPRINAGGRIGNAALGARLLTTDDDYEAAEIAAQLDALNAERRKAETVMLEQAVAEAEAEMAGSHPPGVLVTASDDWHPGVVGLLASRLKDRFRMPAFAIAFDRTGKGTGSGRSVAGIDLGAAVRAAVSDEILEKGGGHAMAAGITVTKEKLGELRAWFENRLAGQVDKLQSEAALKIDGALTARSANTVLLDLLEQVGPFGAGHPTPIFGFPSHRVSWPKIVGENHIAFTAVAGDGAKLRGIAFRAAGTPLGDLILNAGADPCHLAGTLSANLWQGVNRVQLTLLDAASAQ